MKRKLSDLQLIALGLLLGILAQSLYDSFKAWVTPMVEGRIITPLEVRMAIVPIAVAVILVLILFTSFQLVLSKYKDEE